MELIVRPRQGGKTTELIALAAQHFDCNIVCPDRDQAQHVWNMALAAGVHIPPPIIWAEFVEGRYQGRPIHGRFIIDNLDICLQRITGVPIVAASVTGGV